ncbi:glycosyltransferase family 2 protein [Pyrococcus yayanosii]|uniref:Glycosyl transferase, group 2 family protein n=1 Tax=Pyrococcus yayanosii (strain CH1 / JCM 16557) TaxID=529709 RepID=F8AHZ1_PYRYC|nr:glycosyltransferase family 2 protein [Pyrococcus yayanosii]AEH25448.1 glycosyl transferase, group 2 family protein [Pyrococcus yayanosii CH1]
MRTLIVIPAYNEELTIGSVVALAKKYGDVLVVDDGSTDRTSEVAQRAGAVVIRHPTNRGKGAALKTGFEYALRNNYDAVVCLDADGQHNPDEIPLLIDPIIRGEADLVIGSRYLNSAYRNIPLYRRLGLWVLNKATVIASGINVSDSQSGFRALNRKALENLNLDADGYHIESEMIHELAGKGLRIKEVPINVRYDVPKRHKKNPVSHGVGVLAKVVGLIGYKRPLLLFSILSLVSFAIAGVFAYLALKPYWRGGNVFLTQAIAAGIFTLIGIQLFIAGLTLNVLARMVRE